MTLDLFIFLELIGFILVGILFTFASMILSSKISREEEKEEILHKIKKGE